MLPWFHKNMKVPRFQVPISSIPGTYVGSSSPGTYIGSSMPGAYVGSSIPGAYVGSLIPGTYVGSSIPGTYIKFFNFRYLHQVPRFQVPI